MRSTALAIFAHPDDIEYFGAGTLILLKKAGFETHYFNLSTGNCGSVEMGAEETRRVRLAEAQSAASILGAHFHHPICDDLEIFYDLPTLRLVAGVVRQVKPSIILTHPPQDYMEDHTNTCRLAVTAAFCRGMPNYPTQPPTPVTSQSVTLYHAQPYSHHDPLGKLIYPEYYVDVGGLQQRKQEMLALHVSQKQWLDESQGLDSYLKTMTSLDQQLGSMSDRYSHAEGWRRHLHLGFCDATDDPLLDALNGFIFQA